MVIVELFGTEYLYYLRPGLVRTFLWSVGDFRRSPAGRTHADVLASCLRAAGREENIIANNSIETQSLNGKFWVCERLVSLIYEEDRKDSVIPSGSWWSRRAHNRSSLSNFESLLELLLKTRAAAGGPIVNKRYEVTGGHRYFQAALGHIVESVK